MTQKPSNTTDKEVDDELTVTNPAALADQEGIAFERRTYEHDDVEHCETEAAGRAIVGATDANERVLVVVQPQEGHAVLPNETVEPNGDWATIGRERVEAMAGIEVTLNDVQLIREVEHQIDGELRSRTFHVVFSASPIDSSVALDGLCDDNSWELRWIDTVPDWLPDDDPEGAHADIELFVEDDT